MTFEPESLAYDQLESVQAAMSAELELESSLISVSMVGRRVLLEGYVADYGDRERATAIAAMIAGPENVHDRLRDVEEMALTSLVRELSASRLWAR
ncbi:transporter [Rhizobium sp. Root708]|uniref:BON domain-containing protein n=1 Tax=Rhizobium sp. Root708 TaxID=1736592 RepID=UPI0006FD9B39|nr:BON domain-containing protein [Rhizobium sp. Root708]KRB53439.1 transporter [Rhizobium sp. Root708]